MRRLLGCLALLAALAAPWSGWAGPTATFLQAVQDYESGRYEAAAQAFSGLAESGVVNEKLYYDAGNAWLKAGETGRAILWYERARRLDPADPDLAFNLQYARKLVRDEQPERGESMWGMLLFWKDWLGPRAWVWGAVGLSVAFWGLLAVRWTAGRPRSLLPAGAVAAVALIFVLAAGYGRHHRSVARRGVVLEDSVTVRSGTTEAASDLFTLHEGVTVRVQREKNGHVLVRYSTSKFGWVPKKAIGVI
jgi:tetratricopeptide (TPR) repeat protein